MELGASTAEQWCGVVRQRHFRDTKQIFRRKPDYSDLFSVSNKELQIDLLAERAGKLGQRG